ncbi:MAG TPA: Lrp/AsnC ligand binding domain-containing protein, partial [Thermoplasmata archaeon]|nr:Lrp/AsnC ligand binding domain-containing protein [Thermoplasmata archaeon]
LDEVTRRLLEMPNVLQLYHISGEKRLAFVLAAQSLEDLQKTLAEEVADLGFKDEEVVILMKNLRELGSNLEF